MFRSKSKLISLWFLVAVVTVLAAVPAATPAPALATGLAGSLEAEGVVRLQASGVEGVSFQVSVPLGNLTLEPLEVQGRNYVHPELPGWSVLPRVGAPALPYVVVPLGAPHGARLDVHVEPGPAKRIGMSAPVAPVPTSKANWDWMAADGSELPTVTSEVIADPGIYGSDEAYPGVLAAVVSDVVARQQRVVGVAVYPVQVQPGSQELVVYPSLTVSVSFEGSSAAESPSASAQADAEVFEVLFQDSLLNDDAARAWRSMSPGAGAAAIPWAPPDPGYRVYVEAEGIYKLTYGALRDAGLPVTSLNPKTFRMYSQGSEVATHLVGNTDNTFQSDEYILFYGQPVASKYTAYNVYWLTYGGAQGLPMGTRDGTPGAGTTPSSHDDLLHMEENHRYFSGLIGDETLERYGWDYLSPPDKPSWSHTFSLAAPSTGAGMAKLKLALFGGEVAGSAKNAHGVKVYMNGDLIDDISWDGIAWSMPVINFAQSKLQVGANTLKVESAKAKDSVVIDWAALEFANTFVAENDISSFSYGQGGTWKYVVGGFSKSDLVLFDVTDPAAAVRITGASITPSGATQDLTFSDVIAGSTEYWAMSASEYLPPAAIQKDTPSNLGSTSRGADYILVTHAAFATEAATLASHRATHLPGFPAPRIALVDVQDAYDEFGYGVVGAQAIHDFFQYAYEKWQRPAPTYALLVGDGHRDPKNYEGFGRTSFMPPYLAPVDPMIGETAADNQYVSFTAGDNVPDMLLGRLAVNSAAEASVVVNKTVDYEAAPVPGSWREDVLFVADDRDSTGDYAKMSDDLIQCCLPAPYQPEKVYYKVTHPTVDGVTGAIRSGINGGKLFVNYTGQAGVTGWGEQGLFLTSDIPSLANGARLPIMLAMTSYDGYFHWPFPSYGDSMAESIVRATGRGAAASWSATGLAVATGHEDLSRGFFDVAFGGDAPVLGDAVLSGKLRLSATGSNLELLDTYTLFGDPALSILPPSETQPIYLPIIRR